MSRPHLFIGNKRTSTWSLRPWLVLKKAGLDFDETLIPLNTARTQPQISEISPGNTVPVLHLGTTRIWDSLAICEWAAEQVPSLWPADPHLRARARTAASVMHSGFFALRDQCPMDLCRTPSPIALSAATQADIARMQALWAEMKTGEGPWLFGDWSIADAFFTPVADRFRAYAVELDDLAQAYCDTLLNDVTFAEWKAAADQEDYPIPYA